MADAHAPSCCLEEGLRIAERYRVDAISARRFTHAEFWSAMQPALASPAIRVTELGRSVQGREIRALTFGEGDTTVLLWSQMHGDESTATMSLADISAFFALAEGDPLRERLRRSLRVVMIPMLNPDGAEIFRRQNAMGIDVNRDARRLVTPEGRILKGVRDSLTPEFGFNLHDQSARNTAGRTGGQVAIALLAPASDEERSYGPTRSRARLLAAGMARSLEPAIPGRLAKYDDAFNPRAFGDLMQQWGTSTVLVESGATAGDPEKQRLRALNVAVILTALDAIATGRLGTFDPEWYESLPFNSGLPNDLLVLGGTLVFSSDMRSRMDLGIVYSEPVARTGPRIRDAGDLEGALALDTLDATGLFIHPEAGMLTRDRALRLGTEANFTLRRADGTVVRRVGAVD